ncbi:MAG TPA: UDP-glucose/GDP-mannose dehydrogenase family protein [Patescibacteria group bacterium]|nr:UDP-glucose/GDP-mannose dehydrogenase family protein [Patescibacteria group bacterium]
MRIAVVGTGYVGLVSGTCFAEFGIDVTCVDKDAAKIKALKKGQVPIYEPGLEDLLERQIESGRISFTTSLAESVPDADAVFIAVGTPERRSDGHADMSYVWQAARDIAQHLKGYTVIVTKSTVPVGTAREVERIIGEANPNADFDVASNPEFLREGAAVQDFMKPDRVVIGVEAERAQAILREIYRPLYLNETPIVFTKPETAEIIKYAANGFLATKITFINEIADLCEKAGADVQVVAKAIGLDGRISPKFLHAGPGYGGSCFPKDTKALAMTGQKFGAPQNIVETVIKSNEERRRRMARRIIAACGGSVQGKTVAILGISFKPNTDDVRESPSLTIIPLLQEAGARVTAYDPAAMEHAKAHLEKVEWQKDPYSAAKGSDAVAIVTEWNEFRSLDLDRLGKVMKNRLLIDLRNIYRLPDMEQSGFRYISIGRPDVNGGEEVALRAVSGAR